MSLHWFTGLVASPSSRRSCCLTHALWAIGRADNDHLTATSPYNQRRHLTVRKYLAHLAAEQKAPDCAAAVRRHHDQVAALLLGDRDDALGGMLVGHVYESQATPATFAFCAAASRITLAEAADISSN